MQPLIAHALMPHARSHAWHLRAVPAILLVLQVQL